MEPKKPLAALIVAGAKGRGPESEGDDSGGDDEMGIDIAVDEIFEAIDTKNPDLLKAALKSFLDHC
jgi:hypothetical protein